VLAGGVEEGRERTASSCAQPLALTDRKNGGGIRTHKTDPKKRYPSLPHLASATASTVA
jgi:hypothetical protein